MSIMKIKESMNNFKGETCERIRKYEYFRIVIFTYESFMISGLKEQYTSENS